MSIAERILPSEPFDPSPLQAVSLSPLPSVAVAERDVLKKEVETNMGACMSCHQKNKASNDCGTCHEKLN